MKQPVDIENYDAIMTEDFARRFGGIARLYGDAGMLCIARAKVAVIGIGGVGSWVAESLARSGVGAISLIDMDIVAVSNINRQLLATTDSVGRDKVTVMAERIQQINPDCVVNAVDDFIQVDNFDLYLRESFDYIIDCIDDFRTKAALINYCKINTINILTMGAAGGLVDPSKVKQSDLSCSQYDNLLATTRKLLRQKYDFTRNSKISFGVSCVYSEEHSVFPDGNGGVSTRRIADWDGHNAETRALNCAGGIGSITHVTATFGMHAAGFVLQQIANA